MNKSKTAKIAKGAFVNGDVKLGENVGVWYNAVIRGDGGPITVGDGSNVQDCAVIHVDFGGKTEIGKNVTIGHGAIVHGCTLKDNVLVGMGATVLNGAVVEKNCIIGAGAVITQNKLIPEASMVLGVPGKVVKTLSGEDILSIIKNAEHYVSLLDTIEE